MRDGSAAPSTCLHGATVSAWLGPRRPCGCRTGTRDRPARRFARCRPHGTCADDGDLGGARQRVATLFPGEPRRALVEERRDAFAVVRAAPQFRATAGALEVAQLRLRVSALAPECDAFRVAVQSRGSALRQLRGSTVALAPGSASSTHFQDRGPSPPPAAPTACRRASLAPSRARCPTSRGRKRSAGVRNQPDLAKRLDEARRLAATTRSQASAMFAPAPAATPLTAQTTGMGNDRSASTSGR